MTATSVCSPLSGFAPSGPDLPLMEEKFSREVSQLCLHDVNEAEGPRRPFYRIQLPDLVWNQDLYLKSREHKRKTAQVSARMNTQAAAREAREREAQERSTSILKKAQREHPF